MTSGHIKLIEVPVGGCWLSTSFVEKLATFTEEVLGWHRLPKSERPSGILLIQRQPCRDESESWLFELRDQILLQELVERILKFRALISLIMNSPTPVGYASASSCLGTSFEVAMACHRRIWFDPDVLVGFPEMLHGRTPVGGILDQLARRNPSSWDLWEKTPTFAARTAAASGVVDAVTYIADWTSLAVDWFGNTAPHLVATSHRRPDNSVTENAQVLLKESTAIALFANRHPPKLTDGRLGFGVSFVKSLLKERAKSPTPHHFEGLVAHVAARDLLQTRKLSQFSLSVAASSLPDSKVATTGQQSLLVDVGFGLPPLGVIREFFELHHQVCFFARENSVLAPALESLYQRLERELGSSRVSMGWERFVSWFSGPPHLQTGIITAWHPDDVWEIRDIASGQVAEIYSLAGHAPGAALGWVESNSDLRMPRFKELVSILSRGVVQIPPELRWLSVQIRKVLAQEVVVCAQLASMSVSTVQDLLKEDGWSFAADEFAWDRVLVKSSRFRQVKIHSFLEPVQREWSDSIANWRQIKPKPDSTPRPWNVWNSVTIGIHLATWCGLVAESLERFVVPALADLIVAQASGLPEKFGSPRHFLVERGLPRSRAWSALQWHVNGSRGQT